MNNFTYNWNLSDLKNVTPNGLKVFSTFACGGGSTMGYKMSGCEVVAANEIDPKMASVYKKNHNPKKLFVMDIRKLKDKDLSEYKNIDIFDGSPPCSSFSWAGARERDWGKNKKFKEGQSRQILDDLFFHFLDIAEIIKPKVIIAENVKGMIQGNAKAYVKNVFKRFMELGYNPQLFLLNGASMGLPQRRERVFFIANKENKKINLSFKERQVTLREAFADLEKDNTELNKDTKVYKLWADTLPGEAFNHAHLRLYKKNSFFSDKKVHSDKPCLTLTANKTIYHYDTFRYLNKKEICRVSSFPMDYDFLNQCPNYMAGMSVPPLMMHKISKQVIKQLF